MRNCEEFFVLIGLMSVGLLLVLILTAWGSTGQTADLFQTSLGTQRLSDGGVNKHGLLCVSVSMYRGSPGVTLTGGEGCFNVFVFSRCFVRSDETPLFAYFSEKLRFIYAAVIAKRATL